MADTWQEELRAKGYRVTPQRQLVLEAVKALQHGTPEEICTEVQRTARGVNISTIYRTLELLVDSGIVGRVRIGEMGYRYERLRAGEHHDHLICNECGRVIEFFEPGIESLQDVVCERYGFLPLSHSHQMRGICRQCRPRVNREDAAAQGGGSAPRSRRLRVLPTD